MANKEHVEVLKQGPDTWNTWSLERWKLFWDSETEVNFGIADFSGADLRELDLSGLDIGSTDFSYANLTSANLSGADFEDTNFNNAILEKVNLSEAELMGATLEDANLSEANLESAGLVRTNLCRANLSRASLKNTYLQEANLNGANLSEAILTGAQYDDKTIWPEKFIIPLEAIKADYWSTNSSEPKFIEGGEQVIQPITYFKRSDQKFTQDNILAAVIASGMMGLLFLLGGVLGGISSGVVFRVAVWGSIATFCLIIFLMLTEAVFERGKPGILQSQNVAKGRVGKPVQQLGTIRVVKTVVSQMLGGLLCLAIGIVTIKLVTDWTSTWGVHWSDGSQHEFFTTILFGGIGLILLIGLVSWRQFQYSLESRLC